MLDAALRTRARELVADGWSTTSVARHLGVPQSTVWRWANSGLSDERLVALGCWRCTNTATQVPAEYSYLLGQYLGDGHLVTAVRVPVLRVYSCTDHPSVIDKIRDAVAAVRGRPPGVVRSRRTSRMITVQSYWMHWPCVLPQHGPGRKHERPIVLRPWQDAIIAEHPWPLIRGLIHSDGCRSVNTVTVRGRRYSYPRYLFSNESRDILAIMGATLDGVGVRWRYNRPNSISVARRESVELMERHVGAKS